MSNCSNKIRVLICLSWLSLLALPSQAQEDLSASFNGTSEIGFGNVVGSNIANILLILGISTMILPIAVASSTLKRDGVVMIAVAVAFAVIAATMPAGRLVGIGKAFGRAAAALELADSDASS